MTKNIILTKQNLMEYKPYSLIAQRNNNTYVDIIFQNEGLMSVPKSSGTAIIDLLNDAFRNGVKMAINLSNLPTKTSYQKDKVEPEFVPSPMPQEEEHPVNKQVKRL